MKRTIVWLLPILVSGVILIGCSPKSRYDRIVKRELASGVRYDSLFLGLYFGMPEKTFYMHCWDLNKKGMIRQGESNTTVLFDLKKELKHPAVMDFYPRFKEGKIFELPVRFKYTGWAPWNKELSSGNLELDVLEWYKKTYGNKFIKVQHPKRGVAYVQVKGNRRITIFIETDLYVWAYFTDLSVTKESSFSPAK